MSQSLIIRPCSDFIAQIAFPILNSAAEWVQVHSDLLPSAHHADRGIQASNR